jgi:hypothetical protein
VWKASAGLCSAALPRQEPGKIPLSGGYDPAAGGQPAPARAIVVADAPSSDGWTVSVVIGSQDSGPSWAPSIYMVCATGS